MRRFQRLFSFVPVGRAYLAVLVHELHGIYHPEGFLHAAAYRQVVYQFVAHHTVLVYQEQAPVGHHRGMAGNQIPSLIIIVLAGQHAECVGDRFIFVGYYRVGDAVYAPFVFRGL